MVCVTQSEGERRGGAPRLGFHAEAPGAQRRKVSRKGAKKPRRKESVPADSADKRRKEVVVRL